MAVTWIYNKTYAEVIINQAPVNAYELNFMKEFNEVIKQIEANKEISVVLIHSEIEKAFCVGADLKVFKTNTVKQNNKMVKFANKVTRRIEKSDKIYIAAINGHCLGGGLELALACDLRLAKDVNFQLGLPEINIGLIPGNGGTQRLLRVVGQAKALEMLVSRENISPKRALEIGLITKLIPANDWKQGIDAFASHLAAGPRLALAATKKAVLGGVFLSLKNALKLEKKLLKPLETSADYKEGVLAFIEKRKPIFKGK